MRSLVTIVLFLLCSCGESEKTNEKTVSEQAIYELQSIDLEFSDYSKQHGFRKAYLEYIDDDGMLLRDNSMPLIGAKAIENITNWNDSSIVLSWEPMGAQVATSGEMGYTYGTYEMKDINDQVERGTYVTIWKKKEDGKWKFVVDANNQGLSDK